MKISYNIPMLERMVGDIHRLTGISISLLDKDRKLLVSFTGEDYCTQLQKEGGNEECIRCDSLLLERCLKSLLPEQHLCHAGLYDSAMPILKDGVVAGFLLMGRVRAERSPVREDPLYQRLPLLKEEQLLALYDLLPHILFSSGIRIERDPLIEELSAYIKENLQADLRVEALCARFHLSKNSLYRVFREHFDQSVNEYIIGCRLERAKELLAGSKEPLYMVAEKVGMDQYAYFSKLFKERVGINPAAYRKEGCKKSS